MTGGPRQQAILRARQYLERKPVYLDTETTGMDPRDAIVEVAVVDHEGAMLLEQLVRPHIPIPTGATRIHHITDEMVGAAPTWGDVWPQLAMLLRERQTGIYNEEFDLRMLQQSHRYARLEWQPTALSSFCIMKLYADFRNEPGPYGTPRWHRLEDAARQCRVALTGAHRALSDARLARAVLMAIAGARP